MLRLDDHPSGRHFLQIPGPTNVPDRILRALDHPTIDHRGPEFARLTLEILDGLKKIFQTTGPVIVYGASGTGAWAGALAHTPPPRPLARRAGATVRAAPLPRARGARGREMRARGSSRRRGLAPGRGPRRARGQRARRQVARDQARDGRSQRDLARRNEPHSAAAR